MENFYIFFFLAGFTSNSTNSAILRVSRITMINVRSNHKSSRRIEVSSLELAFDPTENENNTGNQLYPKQTATKALVNTFPPLDLFCCQQVQ